MRQRPAAGRPAPSARGKGLGAKRAAPSPSLKRGQPSAGRSGAAGQRLAGFHRRREACAQRLAAPGLIPAARVRRLAAPAPTPAARAQRLAVPGPIPAAWPRKPVAPGPTPAARARKPAVRRLERVVWPRKPAAPGLEQRMCQGFAARDPRDPYAGGAPSAVAAPECGQMRERVLRPWERVLRPQNLALCLRERSRHPQQAHLPGE